MIGALSSVAAAAALALGTVAPELIVEAPPEMRAAAEQVRALSESDFGHILSLTGQVGFRAPIMVVLAPEDSELARSAPEWVSGYARGDRSVVVLFPARVRSYPDRNLKALLTHEIAHVMVSRAAGGRPVPRWFNEGVATVAAREWGLEDRARYAMAVVGSRPRSVRELDAGFSGDAQELRRSYALSSAFVRFLQRRWGSSAPALILAGLAAGKSFDAAFVEATGTTLDRAEWAFFDREAFWHTWLPFLTSSVAIWMAITALALVAIVRRRQRSAAMRDGWDRLESEWERVALDAIGGREPEALDEKNETDDEIVN